jgi:methionine biosynthesis protein MetW
MVNIKKKFYDEAYGGKSPEVRQPKIISYLYKKLKRYEINREITAYNLIPTGQRFLDVGCGEGDLVLKVKSKFDEVWGIDISSVRIEKAKGKLHSCREESRIHFIQGDVDDGLPFEDNFFDVVTCIAVLEHVVHPPTVVREIYRVLKPHGILILEVPNFAWLPYRFQLLFGQLPLTGMPWAHLHNFTLSSLKELLENACFKITYISCSGIFANIRRRWLTVLASDIVVKCYKN